MRRLTVGIVHLDEATMTIQLLSQLGELRSSGWEIQLIVVDSGSARDCVETVDGWLADHRPSFGSVTHVETHENLGSAASRNLILRLSREDRILILDNDVVLPDAQWLERLWGQLDADDELGLIGTMLCFASHGEIVQCAGIGLTSRGRVAYLERGVPAREIEPAVAEVVAFPAACWLLRRELLDEVGFLPEEYHPMQYHPMQYWDVDYCLQIGQAGWKIACDRGASILHHVNTTTENLKTHDFARTALRHGMLFREKYASVLPAIADTDEGDVYWGPVPRRVVGS